MVRLGLLLKMALRTTGLVLLAVVVGVVGFAYFSPDGGDACANEILAQYPSPSGDKRVVVFARNCGATTGFSTQAALVLAGNSLPNEDGNIFSADTDHGAAPSGNGGGPALGVMWRNEKTLLLTRHPRARIFLARNDYDGIHVKHELKEIEP